MIRYFVLGAAICLLVSCGQNSKKSKSENARPIAQAKITQPGKISLMLFAAPGCESCTRKFKDDLLIRIKATGKDQRAKIGIVLWVPTGADKKEKPTSEIAEAYLEELGWDTEAKALPDPWRWTVFRQLIGNKLALPAAALLNDRGDIIKVFPPHEDNFDPEEIMNVISQALKKRRKGQ